MKKGPWVKWYWSDWRSDPKLRMCSIAARGLWAEMLALMQEAVPYGHLLVSGRAPTDAQLAVLAGMPAEQVSPLLGELEAADVFSRTRAGVIYSRRMVRDEKKSKTAQKNGKSGGNPSLCKNKENQPSDNLEVKGGHNTQKPDTRYQKPEERKDRGADAPQLAFVGKVIRLTFEDYERWRTTFSAIPDMRAELEAADAHYAEKPPPGGKWFFPVSNWLKRSHEQALSQQREAASARRSWN
jgi:hypothetical protein